MERRALGRTLVTGAGGFLGAALVARLRADGQAVAATDVALGGSAILDASCDVSRADEVDVVVRDGGFETILHCGAVSGPMVMADRPLDIWRINADGTAHVLEAARSHGVARTVLCSTSEVYGSGTGSVDETSPVSPESVYAASKLAGEHLMHGYLHRHGVDAVALRLSWIYGPGRTTPTALEELLRQAAAGATAVLDASGSDITHYLYIDDAIDAVLAAATAESLPDRVLNATAGAGVPMTQIAMMVRQLAPDARIAFARQDGASYGPSDIGSARAHATIGFRAGTSLEMGIANYLRHLECPNLTA